MLSVTFVIVILSVIMRSVVMLSVVILNVVMPSVVALSRDKGHIFVGEKKFL
jgi:hypothetical protein